MESAIDTRQREDGGYGELLVGLRGCAIAGREERCVLLITVRFAVLMLEVGSHLSDCQLEMKWDGLDLPSACPVRWMYESLFTME